MPSRPLRLFQTLPHACGYFRDRTARNVVLDPAAPDPADDYARALQLGFRRAGDHVYRPHCPGCQACIASRISVADFVPDRSQRRCARRNGDLVVTEARPGATPEHFDLYARYLRARHAGGGMDPPNADDFEHFLTAPWSATLFLEFRAAERLVAVAVTDICTTGASAVYTFFDPALRQRSLGTLAILKQVELCRRRGLPHLYLGFWIKGHSKMEYKARFRPLELLDRHGWRELAEFESHD